jgi:hypothetical protein
MKTKYYFRGRRCEPHGVTVVSRVWGFKAESYEQAAALAAKLARRRGWQAVEDMGAQHTREKGRGKYRPCPSERKGGALSARYARAVGKGTRS